MSVVMVMRKKIPAVCQYADLNVVMVSALSLTYVAASQDIAENLVKSVSDRFQSSLSLL